ncbi:putative O-glycosylation ligase, exosortase A system-associated [Ectothiorhodospira variabilis]|uniref:putative O-glycosylation ligase, exosortase A system-associated n=1 Tax=Ectothiorhodospira variabilis TaxID=505694 RepID=UPI001EFC01BC|nr:putative O-glycosylation ligase, exosortase A system-associated [Ectothiorhodospira variabilis]MCG5494758.1 putative O-glycosylation ligase, exosortase A system-associated [Ectothiorhodospira variabilis]MCG5504353.1 putative O-glycosylation ligase, exosortase A system-associated [Ectothiorhodospira variabilis]MCG5507508.1 putative O-glycosylation ligase, exosortase A system-associated [Ectothiorhodospira variabilis]
MRDLALLAILGGLVPLILMRPWIGILAWFWVGLMVPHAHTWGFMRSFPIAVVIGLVTLIAVVLTKDRRPIPMSREMVILIVFALYTALTSAFAVLSGLAWDFWMQFMKILLITVVAPMLIFGQTRVLWLLLVITCSLAFYGLKGGVFAIATGGAHMVLGPRGSFLSGNTYIGLAMVMVLPLILVTARLFRESWVKWKMPLVNAYSTAIGYGFYGTFWLTALAILATYSRGAFLGILAVAPFIFIRMRHKWALVLSALVLVGVVGVTAPERLVDRWATIQTYEEDGSAMQRIQAWGVNWNMAMERPLVGMGFRNFYLSYDEWIQYANFEGTWNFTLSPHSIYFGVLGAHGFVGLAVFLLMLFFTMLTLNRIRRVARSRPGQIWLSEYAWALQVGLFGYMVAGAFLDVAYFNLMYIFVALAVILRRELEESSLPERSFAENQEPVGPLGPRFPDFIATK